MGYLSRLRQTFWFLPAVMCVAAVLLAEVLIFIDQRIEDADLGPLGFVVTRVGESGSRDLLGAVAGSMLTVASTTFSITIAVLALSSSTYGPRLVRNFMANRGNQVVLGVFVATFLYSLLVLRSIRVVTEGSDYFVPHLAVNMAVFLALLSIGFLVYFIHHISDSVQVWTLAQQVNDQLLTSVDRLYPERMGKDVEEADVGTREMPAYMAVAGAVFSAPRSGYVVSVDYDGLFSLARKHDLVVSLDVRPGRHVVEGAALGCLRPPDRAAQKVLGEAQKAIGIGRARTPTQDVEFSVLLLEEMAVRALSPSTNDPYTAVNALDQLAAGIVPLAGRRTPSAYRYDDEDQLRVIAPHVSVIDVLDHLLEAMRLYAIQHPSVLRRTLTLVQQVAAASDEHEFRDRLAVQVQRLHEAMAHDSLQACDAKELRRHAEQVLQMLRSPLEELQGAESGETQ